MNNQNLLRDRLIHPPASGSRVIHRTTQRSPLPKALYLFDPLLLHRAKQTNPSLAA